VTNPDEDPHGPPAETERDDPPSDDPLEEIEPETIKMTLGQWQGSLSQYLDAELDHSVGAYRLANRRLRHVQEFLRTQPEEHALTAGVATVVSTARKLNQSLATKRYAVGDGYRLPSPPEDVLDFRSVAAGDDQRRIHAFYEVARGALNASPRAAGSLGLIRQAILLDLHTQYDVNRLTRRYAHRAQQAHEVLWLDPPSPEGTADATLADAFASAGLHYEDGATPALVLLTMTQAHLDLHLVEHRRSQPVGRMMSRTDEDLLQDRQALERAIALNTFAFASCEALPWLFSAGLAQQRKIQSDPKGARTTIAPLWPLWIARQALLLALYRRGHCHRLLGDNERAYNDLRKVQRIGRLTRTTLNDPTLHDHPQRKRMLHFVDALDALAEYRIGELYRADHDYSQALVHLCRSHERVERWTTVDEKGEPHPWWDRDPPSDTSQAKPLFPQLEVNLRLGKGRAFFEIGSIKRSLKWYVRAWISLLELMSDESGVTDKEVRALERYLAEVKHDPELDKGWLIRFLESAVPEMCEADVSVAYEALAADILARISQVLVVIRLEDKSALTCLRHAAELDRRNLLAQTGLLLCKLREHYPEFEFMLSDPTECWSSASSDIDQAIRAAEHLMLERLAAASPDMVPDGFDPRDVTIARRLIEDFMTHTDSINLRLAVLHLYLTRPRAPLQQPELAPSATQAPYLEFVCLRRFGCFSPFMPRPAAVSAVGGGYLIRACWPEARDDDGKLAPKVINVLIDPGEGTVNNLYRVGLGIADVDMVIATHDHPDHLVALDEILSLRQERHEIQGSARERQSKRFVILGNSSIVERYAFLNRQPDNPDELRYAVAGISDEHPPDMPAEIVFTRLCTRHVDLGGANADGFVLTFRPAGGVGGDPLSITFMSDTAIRAVGAVDSGYPTEVLGLNPGWEHALRSDIVVAHVSDVPSGELRDLAHLPKQYGTGGVADFNRRVGDLAKRAGGRDAERLRHALSMIRREPDGTLRPTGLFDPAFLKGRAEWEQHLYLHGLLAVAKLMDPHRRARNEGGPRVLIIGEFREQLGSFRGAIAREINRHVFRPGTIHGPELPEHIGKPMALTADIGLRIRVESGGNRNRVLCSTCSRNNDRLDAERFHRPEQMNEVCVKGDHEAMYWNCRNHIPAQRPEGPVFVEQMGGYDPFAPGGRFHG
jgi:tetratricopeptide (TPR) repeat protein